MAHPALNEILEHLKGVRGLDANGWYTAFCPFHDDQRRPNLRFTENGFRCLACNEKGSILKLADKLGVPRTDAVENRPQTTYDYRDERGNLLFQVVRLHSPKDFRQRRPDGNGGWHRDLKGSRRVLYRLLALIAAEPNKPVSIAEGEKGDALYLALEDTKRRLQGRLNTILDGQEPPPCLELGNAWPRMDDGGLEALEDWLSRHPQARLVIIDTLARVRPVKKYNDSAYDFDYESLGGLKALADRFGVAILVIHHLRKLGSTDPVDAISGTLGLTGAADGVLVLKRERGQHDAALFVTGRDVDEQELALVWHAPSALWAKDRFVLGRADYQRQYEPVWYGWPEGASHHWCGGRDQGNVWTISRPADSRLHPTMKPLALVERAIEDSSRQGDTVLDLFLGSGTTLIAAERTGRVCYALELEPAYIDVAVARWEAFSGERAEKE